MRFQSRFLLAMDLLLDRKKNFFLVIVLLSSSLLITTWIAIQMSKNTDDIKKYQALFLNNSDTLCQIVLNTGEVVLENQDVITEFVRSFSDIDGIKNVGYFMDFDGGIDESRRNEEIADIIYEINPAMNYYDLVRVPNKLVFASKQMTELVDWNIDPEISKKLFDDPRSVAVGEALSELFDIGDIIHFYGNELKVVGYIPKRTYWPAEGYMEANYANTLDMGYHFFMASDFLENANGLAPFVNSLYIQLNKASDYTDVSRKLHELAAENNVGISVKTMDDALRNIYENRKDILGLYAKLLAFLWLISMMTFLMSAIIAIMLQRRKIGIWYSIGFADTDIISFICIEQLFKVVFSVLIAFNIGYFFLGNIVKSYQTIFLKEGVRFMLILAGINYILMVIAPVAYLKKQNIIRLLQAKD